MESGIPESMIHWLGFLQKSTEIQRRRRKFWRPAVCILREPVSFASIWDYWIELYNKSIFIFSLNVLQADIATQSPIWKFLSRDMVVSRGFINHIQDES